MIVYFDESYDNAHDYLLYGALFLPRGSRLHQRISRIRREMQFPREIKYNRCKNPFTLRVCRAVVDAFVEDTAYFRCVVVEQHGFDYSGFGRADESLALKQARAYKKFAEMLLAPYVEEREGAVFLADELNRCNGDEFLERMRQRFNVPGRAATFRHMVGVSSSLEQYQCLQVCDLLLGCVLNNLKPTKKQAKNDIRSHLCDRIHVPNLLRSTWQDVPPAEAREPATKFNVWYWETKGARKKPR